ncbi:hypothetical protein [Reyranella sp.]|uniref:hypothetical protein n=1 Tax=Reyranella sp. TaxID=1929291 RepID=UPI003D1460CB
MGDDNDVQTHDDQQGAGDAGASSDVNRDELQQQAQETDAFEAGAVDYDKVIADALTPEGVALDPGLTQAGSELLARHNIPPEAARDLASFFARQQKAGAEGNARAFADQVGAWRAQSEKRTTPEERGTAKEAALRIFGRDELAVLDLFGVTNRAGFIKALSKVGKAIRDDVFVPGNAAVNGDRDARSHFPNSNMNP